MKTSVTIRDCRGRRIFIGSPVAYNRSGHVVPGHVVGIFPKWRKVTWHPGQQWWGYFLIKNDLDNTESRVKNVTSIMVTGEVLPDFKITS